MSSRVIRIARRLSTWENADITEIVRTEFRTKSGPADLRPSVYLVTQQELTRTCAEHIAAAEIDPSRTTAAIDLHDAAPLLLSSPGNPHFSFTRDRHREVELRDEADLREMIGRIVGVGFANRACETPKSEVVDYARARLGERDPEWVDRAISTKVKWLRALAPTTGSGP